MSSAPIDIGSEGEVVNLILSELQIRFRRTTEYSTSRSLSCGTGRTRIAHKGTGWQLLRRSSSAIVKLRNASAPSHKTGRYSRRRHQLSTTIPWRSTSLYFDANAYAG
jgi:hypothetical protein